jgi:hypothetical protein
LRSRIRDAAAVLYDDTAGVRMMEAFFRADIAGRR